MGARFSPLKISLLETVSLGQEAVRFLVHRWRKYGPASNLEPGREPQSGSPVPSDLLLTWTTSRWPVLCRLPVEGNKPGTGWQATHPQLNSKPAAEQLLSVPAGHQLRHQAACPEPEPEGPCGFSPLSVQGGTRWGKR